MPVRCLALFLLAALGACEAVEHDIRMARLRENVRDIWMGRDRGLWGYATIIEQSKTAVDRGTQRYQYLPPAHESQYMIQRAILGLGGTRIDDVEMLANVVDVLLFVTWGDPAPAVRGLACRQLGRVLERLPAAGDLDLPLDPASDERINTIANDLRDLQGRIEAGERVSPLQVVSLMRALARERPTRFRNAVQMVRALTALPVGGNPPGPVTDALVEIAPTILRDCVLVALRDLACGHPVTGALPDPSPIVRADAAAVLAGVAPRSALQAVTARLWDRRDPAETESDVRRPLVSYLGMIGGPEAFETCLRRLDDHDASVRFQAHLALVRMTGANAGPAARDWQAWREGNPAWRYQEPGET